MLPKTGDLSGRHSLSLLSGRMGIYDKKPFLGSTVDGVNQEATSLRQSGGYRQQERMIADKKRSLDRAVWYSYQGALVRDVQSEICKPFRALINPNKLKQDYDDKIISIEWDAAFKPGTVFEWLNTHSYWLIYLQDLTELAYFRGDIRRCSYEIEWLDENGDKQSTFGAVRGPVETKINYIQKHQISVDVPNHSLDILMPKNEETLKYFRRYSKFYLQDLEEGDQNICWRVEATDSISMPGILEVVAVEYYANESEDDIEEGIVGGLIVKPIDPNPPTVEIIGETFIKPKEENVYTYTGTEESSWACDDGLPVSLDSYIDESGRKCVRVKWCVSYHGQFDLHYGESIKTIVVESLF